MLTTVATTLVKRAILTRSDDTTDPPAQNPQNLPWGLLAIGFLLFILLIPLYIFVNYTLNGIYPTLAIIEDENPPAYEPLSLTEQDDLAADPERNSRSSKPTSGVAKPVTASLRSIFRLVRSTGGFRANFRGFWCFFALAVSTNFLKGIFAVLGTWFTPIATLITSLALVQFSTAWVHIVITPQFELHFWQRLPPFRQTLKSTFRPVLLSWFSVEVARAVPFAVAAILGAPISRLADALKEGNGDETPIETSGLVWKLLVVLAVAMFSFVFIVTPTHVILVRVQASLLPEDRDPIVPFDRSFQGMLEPSVVGGRQGVTIQEAWKTFSKSAWRRLVILYVKVFSISMGVTMVLGAIGAVTLHSVLKQGQAGAEPEWVVGPADPSWSTTS